MSTSTALRLINDLLNTLEPNTSMTSSTNSKQLKIKLVPTSKHNFCDGVPDINKNFQFVDTDVLNQKLKENQVLVQAEYISVDPYLRFRLGQYAQSPDETCLSGQVARVLKSNCSRFQKGDIVFGYFPWQTYSIITWTDERSIGADAIELVHRPSKNQQESDISHSYYIGAYGMPGMTAYYGLLEKAQMKKNSILLVSGGAGAVGSVVGQIGKIYNCYVIGSAGTKEKCNWLKNKLGFDYVFNYKEYKNIKDMQNNLRLAIKDANNKGYKGGINYYFDNTGGTISQATWDLLAPQSQVIICGQISIYNRAQNEGVYMEPHFTSKLIYREIVVRGIIVGNISDEYRKKFRKDMREWILNKKVKVQQTVINGFQNVPKALAGLFDGTNIGKMVVKV